MVLQQRGWHGTQQLQKVWQRSCWLTALLATSPAPDRLQVAVQLLPQSSSPVNTNQKFLYELKAPISTSTAGHVLQLACWATAAALWQELLPSSKHTATSTAQILLHMNTAYVTIISV